MIPPDLKKKCKSFIINNNMVKSMGFMDMAKMPFLDLKSLVSNGVPVRVRSSVPY